MTTSNKKIQPVFFGVFLVAMATLATEVILTRIFSFSIWYHFAYMTINVALLGFGSSGAILSSFPGIMREDRWKKILVISTVLSAAILLISFLAFARYPLQPQKIFVAPLGFMLSLIIYYIGISLPFFFAGLAIAMSLSKNSDRVSTLYFWDLCGAALGALLALAGLNWVGAVGALFICIFIMILAACCFSAQVSKRLTAYLMIAAALLLCLIPLFKDKIKIIPCDSKVLANVYNHPETYKPLYTEWNAINRVDVYTNVKKTDLPFWGLGGVSKNYKGGFPEFHDMQYDAHNGSNIYHLKNDIDEEFRFLDQHVLKTPYVLLDKPKVLILGVGGGIDVFNALKNKASSITAIELQPIAVKLLKGHFSTWVGNIYTENGAVNLIAGEGRNYINSTDQKFDLIQINVTDTFAALNTGAYVLMESYLYTEEAFDKYFNHLSEQGLMCIIAGDHLLTGSSSIPPLTIRLLLQYINVLKQNGIAEPYKHIAILGASGPNKNDKSFIPLVKKTPLTPSDMNKMTAFADNNGFEITFNPLLQQDSGFILNTILRADTKSLKKIISEVPYNVTPCTDDNPFFYNFIKWETVFNVFNARKYSFTTPVFGQAILLFLLVQSIVFSFFFIIMPLLVSKRRFTWGVSTGYLLYFFCLGVGFMFMEISFIQKFVLFLGYPAYAFAITLFSLLLFSGLGSYWTGALKSRPEKTIKKIICLLVPTLLAYTLLLDTVFEAFIGLPFLIKCIITVLTQLPLGLLLGMFFPLGIKLVSEYKPEMVPWAWGVNGMSSVVSTVGAIIIAMSSGFRFVSYLAIIVYCVGTLSLLITRAATLKDA